MILYGLKTCDTCRKAMKSLPDAAFVDVRIQGIPVETLTRALDHFGPKLVNTRSKTWRELGAKDRERPQIDLLLAYPALMKRPLIVVDDQMWLGWTPETQVALGVA